MCGIVGYIGNRKAQQILLDGLEKLEYRGYDSAGIAVYTGGTLKVAKTKGRLAQLRTKLASQPIDGTTGIAHTRWATHGKPSDENSHPHVDENGTFAVVHNGIIENHVALKEELLVKGYTFTSETDTEVIAHLLADLYEGDIVATVRQAVKKLRGAYALAVMCEHEPDKLVAVRLASPLVVGIGQGENLIGSDIPAILNHTRDVYILEDGDMAVLTRDEVRLMSLDGVAISREMMKVEWDAATAEKGGYAHFMLKEIYEQPKAYQDTMSGRIHADGTRVDLGNEFRMSAEEIGTIRQIQIVACGTAYHAGLVGKIAFESLARIPVSVEVASEYRYSDPIIDAATLVIVVSQSGETADTLAALREAKRKGARIVAITNVVGSSVAREADDVILTLAGPEIAVASTKAYTSQLVAFYLLGLYVAQMRGTIDEKQLTYYIKELQALPEKVAHILSNVNEIKALAESIAASAHLFFIGRGLDYAVAEEGSLKLKEISYIHSEAYAAGELKHGTLALIEEGIPVIALATQADVLEKTISNMKEVAARGAKLFAIACEDNAALSETADAIFGIPQTDALFMPALSVVPLQLLAYYAALARGNDVDKPRNLAKSVTVE